MHPHFAKCTKGHIIGLNEGPHVGLLDVVAAVDPELLGRDAGNDDLFARVDVPEHRADGDVADGGRTVVQLVGVVGVAFDLCTKLSKFFAGGGFESIEAGANLADVFLGILCALPRSF